jgi:hypothetical protein
MSKPASSSGQPIPTVILVSEASRANKADRSAPKRKSASPVHQLPWLWIAGGGGVAWMGVVLVIAVTSMSQEPERPPMPNAREVARVGAVEPVFQAQAIKAQERNAIEPAVKRPAPIDAVDEAPPVHLAAAPGNFADPRLFANCEQIGSKVQLMREPPAAFQRAKAERKMVFIVHLSGNLEDKDFT